MNADFNKRVCAIRKEAECTIFEHTKEHGQFLFLNEVYFDSGCNGSYPAEMAIVDDSWVYGLDCDVNEVSCDYDADSDENGIVSAVMGYEEVAMDSIVEIADFVSDGNLSELLKELVDEAKSVVESLGDEMIEIKAYTNILDDEYDFYSEDIVRAGSKTFFTKDGLEWDYSHLKSDDLMPVVDGIVRALNMRPKSMEADVLQKLARSSKMDCWFGFDKNGCIRDFELDGKLMKPSEALDQMLDGLVKEDYDCLDKEEMIILIELLHRIRKNETD